MRSQLPFAEEHLPISIVRLQGTKELTRILALTRASPEAPAWPADAWTSFLEHNAGEDEVRRTLFATVSDRKLSGIVAVLCLDDITELEMLLVHPDFRRQGIGRALSIRWLRWAGESGAGTAMLEVRASNRAAQALYRALGFEIEGRRSGYYQRPDEDALLMRKTFPG